MAAERTLEKIRANSPSAEYVDSIKQGRELVIPTLETVLRKASNKKKQIEKLCDTLGMLSCNGMSPEKLCSGLKKATLEGNLEKATWFARELHIFINTNNFRGKSFIIMMLRVLSIGILSPRDVLCVSYIGWCLQKYHHDPTHIKPLCHAVTFLNSGLKSNVLNDLVLSAYVPESTHHTIACEMTKTFSFAEHVEKIWECLDSRDFWWCTFHASRCLEVKRGASYNFYPVKGRMHSDDYLCGWLWNVIHEKVQAKVSNSEPRYKQAVVTAFKFMHNMFKYVTEKTKLRLNDDDDILATKGMYVVGALMSLYFITNDSEDMTPQPMNMSQCMEILAREYDESFEWSRDHAKDNLTLTDIERFMSDFTTNLDTCLNVPTFIFNQQHINLPPYDLEEPFKGPRLFPWTLALSASKESHPSGAKPKQQRGAHSKSNKRNYFRNSATSSSDEDERSSDCAKPRKISKAPTSSFTTSDSLPSYQGNGSSSACAGRMCKPPSSKSKMTSDSLLSYQGNSSSSACADRMCKLPSSKSEMISSIPDLNKCGQPSVSMAPKKILLKRAYSYYGQQPSMSENKWQESSSVALADIYPSSETVDRTGVLSKKQLLLTDIANIDETAYYNSSGKQRRTVVYRRVSDGTLRTFKKMTHEEATVQYFALTLKKSNILKDLKLNSLKGDYGIVFSWVNLNDVRGCLEAIEKPITVFDSGCVYRDDVGNVLSFETPLETRLSKLPSHRNLVIRSPEGQLQMLHIMIFRLILGLPIPTYSNVIIDVETNDLYSTGETSISLIDPDTFVDKIRRSEVYKDKFLIIKEENLPSWANMDFESTTVLSISSNIQEMGKACAVPNEMLLNILENLKNLSVIIKKLETYD